MVFKWWSTGNKEPNVCQENKYSSLTSPVKSLMSQQTGCVPGFFLCWWQSQTSLSAAAAIEMHQTRLIFSSLQLFSLSKPQTFRLGWQEWRTNVDFFSCPSASWLALFFILSCFSAQYKCTNWLSEFIYAWISASIIMGKLQKLLRWKPRSSVVIS